MKAIKTTLLDALGITHLEPEEQEKMLLDLHDLIFKGTTVRLIEMMDDETKVKFDELLSSDPEEEQIQAFFTQYVPAADQAVADTVKELTDDILAVTGESQD